LCDSASLAKVYIPSQSINLLQVATLVVQAHM
jgi:hypothetical protein